MPSLLKDSHPIARKEHICNLCWGKINKGQRYYRQTNVYDGHVYDWIEHEECRDITQALDMFNECDYDGGLTSDYFNDIIDDYIYQKHYDEATDDIAKDWQRLTRYEKVCKILTEFNLKKI